MGYETITNKAEILSNNGPVKNEDPPPPPNLEGGETTPQVKEILLANSVSPWRRLRPGGLLVSSLTPLPQALLHSLSLSHQLGARSHTRRS